PAHWQKDAQSSLHTYTSACQAEDKVQRLRELGSLDNITQIDIHAPTLDEMYAEFLKREDV
ncbi:ABC transporter ATP-binding protein, partial [Kingella kingae]|nr:ABC transporter ATP-binding protein [Kingella kingae]